MKASTKETLTLYGWVLVAATIAYCLGAIGRWLFP